MFFERPFLTIEALIPILRIGLNISNKVVHIYRFENNIIPAKLIASFAWIVLSNSYYTDLHDIATSCRYLYVC